MNGGEGSTPRSAPSRTRTCGRSMVWRRMGLLDDAIRDHLELKRLRGADPGEVAREQREALEPDPVGESGAVPDTPATALEDPEPEPEPDHATMPVRATSAVMPESPVDSRGTPEIGGDGADSPTVAEETAELDMRTVMDEPEAGSAGEDSFDSLAGAGAGPAGGAASVEVLNEDQLEWEVPGESSAESPTDAEPHGRAVGGDGR
jgi:hypothetical protein